MRPGEGGFWGVPKKVKKRPKVFGVIFVIFCHFLQNFVIFGGPRGAIFGGDFGPFLTLFFVIFGPLF